MPFINVKLSDVCEVIAGQSPPSSSYNDNGIGLPFFQGKADFGQLNPSIRMWCSEPKKVSLPNDILMSVRAPVGPTNINNVTACVGRGLSAIRCGDKIVLSFLLHFLRSNEQVIADKGTGSTFKAITQKELRALEIPLPPIEEQKKIAEILDVADSLRQKDQQLVEHYDRLSQSLFLELFGDPVNNPKNWKIKEFGGIYNSLKYGVSTPPKYFKSGIPFIRATNVKKGGVAQKGMVFISQKEAEKISKCKLTTGDLIVVRSGANTGDCCRIPCEYNGSYGGFDMIIKIDEPYSTFYNFLLNTPAGKAILKPLTRRAGQPHLNSQQMFSLNLIAPPINEQEKFSDRINKIEKQKKLAQQSLQKSNDLFNSLLQRAFKGELTNA